MHIFIFGLVNSVILALLASGFALVYGVSRLANFAHGALYILVGFSTWLFLHRVGINYIGSIVLSILIVSIIGGAIYRFLLIRVKGMPDSEIIASLSIGIAIMELFRWRGFISEAYMLPPFIKGSVNILGVTIDWQRLLIIGVGFAIMVSLWLFTHHTKVGLSLRAIAQDKHASMMSGIEPDQTAVIALALGSALAGISAVVILPLGNITVETGYMVLINAIAVCIVGGLGSWAGVFAGALLLGFSQILATALLGPHWQMVVVLLFIILTLIIKPSGLLGRQKELEERV
ncbi:MAG: branched-chain amino acid ABC transporter permease [Thermodesulfobacteriota bacterium]